MQLKTIKINNESVKPIPTPKIETKNIIGYKLFPEPYTNIFICAKKKSGKTCTLFHILQSCINLRSPTTIVHIFASTVNKDSNYRHICKWLKSHGINSYRYTEITPLKEVLTAIDSGDQSESSSESEPENNEIHKFLHGEKYKQKLKKPKYIAPEHIFIFDDLSKELQSKDLSALLKKNRHYKSKIIISSQYPNDLATDARKQIDNWLIFRGHSLDKLETIYNNADLHIPLDNFLAMYNYATKDKYNFLYIDTVNSTFRKNFDTEIKNIDD